MMGHVIMKSAGDEISFISMRVSDKVGFNSYQLARQTASDVTEAMKIAALFDNDLDKAQQARQALDLLIKECGSLEWAIAHFAMQKIDGE